MNSFFNIGLLWILLYALFIVIVCISVCVWYVMKFKETPGRVATDDSEAKLCFLSLFCRSLASW